MQPPQQNRCRLCLHPSLPINISLQMLSEYHISSWWRVGGSDPRSTLGICNTAKQSELFKQPWSFPMKRIIFCFYPPHAPSDSQQMTSTARRLWEAKDAWQDIGNQEYRYNTTRLHCINIRSNNRRATIAFVYVYFYSTYDQWCSQHRRIAGGARGCCSTPKLSEKSEIFRLSEILGCLSEIFVTYICTKTNSSEI